LKERGGVTPASRCRTPSPLPELQISTSPVATNEWLRSAVSRVVRCFGPTYRYTCHRTRPERYLRGCLSDAETTSHVVVECPAYALKQHSLLPDPANTAFLHQHSCELVLFLRRWGFLRPPDVGNNEGRSRTNRCQEIANVYQSVTDATEQVNSTSASRNSRILWVESAQPQPRTRIAPLQHTHRNTRA
jgi:hypothetical protein